MSRVYSVDHVDVEALITIPENPRAISVSAAGWVPTSGWSRPDLAPWMYIVPPQDGILDLDFVASPPTGMVLQVLAKISVVRSLQVPHWVKGVRVHASTNAIEKTIAAGTGAGAARPTADVLPVPWPFPWWAPEAK